MYVVMHLSMEPAYYQGLGISGIGSGFVLENELVNRPKTLPIIEKRCVLTKPPDLGTVPMICLLFFVSQNMSVHLNSGVYSACNRNGYQKHTNNNVSWE
jgi:hypothetical protein